MTPVAVADNLLAHDLIGYADDLIYSPQLAFSTDLPVKWTSRIEVSGAVGQFEAVKSGAGIGILHKFMAASDPQLVPVLPEIALTRSYWTVWHENLRAKREVKLIADYLEHIVRQDKGLFM